MANYTAAKQTGATGASIMDADVLSRTAVFDFASITSAAGGDTIDVFDLPVGAIVLGAALEVLVLDAGAGTIALTVAGVSHVAASTAAAVGPETSLDIAPHLVISGTQDVSLVSATAAITTGKVKATVVYAMSASPYSGLGGVDEPTVIVAAG